MTTAVKQTPGDQSSKPRYELSHAAVRFAGDSGDGMQLAGTQFTNTSAVLGNDISTLPDYPAEIRAPAGSLFGVSGFQIHFSSTEIHTPGDRVDALVCMNPAALKVNLKDLVDGGVLIINTTEFTPANLNRAKYEQNPLETGELDRFRVFTVPITMHTMEAVKETKLNVKAAGRCKNFYALGLVYWLYDRPLDTTLEWINNKFGKVPAVAQANALALKAGFNFGETAEMFPARYRVAPAKLKPGTYRNLTGNQAAALGAITAARLAKKPLFYGSYPITPASEILHELSLHKQFDVRTFQAEDEIAAMCAVIGASYAGCVSVTGTSGPGIALKQEAIGLAIMTELPCVIINVQRGGPSTGLPTKTEQSDLWQALYGRNGEAPLPVIAAQSPADCFWATIEAIRVAVKYMTPVFMLSDGYLANGSAPWRIPDADQLAPIEITHPTDPDTFLPYSRNAHGGRPWAIPGTKGLEHRVGGLEKQHETGHVCHIPENHEFMIKTRAEKVANVVADVPDAELFGDEDASLLIVSWGSTYGATRAAAEALLADGKRIAHLHLRWLNPLPKNVGEILNRFEQRLVCENNMGQLRMILEAKYHFDLLALNKVQGRPFVINDITSKVTELLGGN